MTGITLSGVGIGTVIIPPIASRLISIYTWRASYIITGIIVLVLVTLAAQFLRSAPCQMGLLPYGENGLKQEDLMPRAKGFSLREAINTKQFWLFFTILFAFGFITQIIMVHIVIHAIDLGVSAITAASIPAIMGGAGIAGRLIMGGAADRVGHKPILPTGFALLSLSLLWLLMTKELWGIYLFAVIFGFSLAGLATLEAPLIAGLFGLNSLGLILGSVELVATVFAAPSPMLAGHIFDTMDSYQLAFLICAVLGIIGVLLALLLRLPSSEGGKK